MRVLLVRPTASGGLAAHVDQELALLESTGRRVAEAPVRIRERPSPRHDAATVTALRRIVRGGADDSYGIEVAKLAGVPNAVIKRAKAVLADLEATMPKPEVREVAEEEGLGLVK